ncbi:YeeE/YedE family protein [bacterium]|nr:YeeE/YedE family protein [bacterium]MBU1883711.1 YeeE/YedE family protein [bacterium]
MLNHNRPRRFLPPLVAGMGLGLTLMGIFLLSGHGLGASGFFKRVTALLGDALFGTWAQDNAYLGSFLKGYPLDSWISWEVGGVAIGGLLGSLLGRRFKVKVERGHSIDVPTRFVLALTGGVLSGFGAALARGCTSGTGLSGGATLSVSAYLFLIGFFVAGLLTAKITRKVW